jgi:Fe-S-cluster containining protein
MLFVPWKYIANWECVTCGKCCRAYSVVLNFQEWLKIVRNYGVDKTIAGIDKIFIKRKSDGSCIFLGNISNLHFCGLQHMKPKACKLWPFKIFSKPKYGYANEAVYYYGKRRFFVYADSNCTGLTLGRPSWEFTYQTVREFVEIALGLCNKQRKTTSNVALIEYPNVLENLKTRKYYFRL